VILFVPVAAASGPWHAALHMSQAATHVSHDHQHDSDAPHDESHCPVWQLLHMPMLSTAPIALPVLTERVTVLDQRVVSLHTLTVEHQHSGRAPPTPLPV